MIMRVIEYFIIPASTPNRNYLRLICVLSYIRPRLCIYTPRHGLVPDRSPKSLLRIRAVQGAQAAPYKQKS